MDGTSFDDFTRAIQRGASRRRIIGALTGGLVATLGAGRATAKPAGRVGICHRTGRGGSHYIQVSWNAAPAHAVHGDTIDVDLQNDPNNCGACGNVRAGDGCNAPVCQNGVCATTPGTCAPPNACTTAFYDPGLGCVIELIDCGTSDACTTVSCDPAIGCIYEPYACEDGNPCTIDYCDPTGGGCRYDPNTGASCTTVEGLPGICDAIGECQPEPAP